MGIFIKVIYTKINILRFDLPNCKRLNKKRLSFYRQPPEFTTLKNPQKFVFFRSGVKGTLTH